MADISKIKLPNGNTYDIKDESALTANDVDSSLNSESDNPVANSVVTAVNSQAVENAVTLGYSAKNYLPLKIKSAGSVSNPTSITSLQKDGGVYISGVENSQIVWVVLYEGDINKTLLKTDHYYILSYRTSDNSDFSPLFVFYDYNDGTGYHTLLNNITQGQEAIFKFPIGTQKILIRFNIIAGCTTNRLIFPMIRDARITDDTYVPYKPPVTESISRSIENAVTLGYSAKNLLPNKGTSHGIFTVNEDKSITINGTVSDTYEDYYLYGTLSNSTPLFDYLEDDATYIFTSCDEAASSSIQIWFYSKQTGAYDILRYAGNVYYFTKNRTGAEIYSLENVTCVFIRVLKNATINNVLIKPMLRNTRITDNTYVPYQSTVEERLTALESAIANLGS